MTILLILTLALSLGFSYTNGFHDTANAIATSVSTRALTPRVAVSMAAVANLVGALYSTEVARTVGKGIVDIAGGVTVELVFAGVAGAVVWNLVTWYFGIPSSSSHALIGGLVGAALMEGGSGMVRWDQLVAKVILPMVTSPLAGFVVAYLLMLGLLWLVRSWTPVHVNRWFRWLQVVSATFMAVSHGRNDAQNAMGVMTLALLAAGQITEFVVPLWVILASAGAMAAGTYSGGWRIIHTLGSKVIRLDPIHGFAAETSAAVVIQVASNIGAPISTTQTITAAIMGVGSTQRIRAVRWGVARRILVAWVLTLPAAGAVAALTYVVISAIV
ncbi:MAG TPA: inorganic phosphate transporter [Thermoleophilia bacterium]|nr:inorganic phosphate transporter [Thermoleophilia bacterium]